MAEGRMDKIYSMEIAPPPESWEKLAARLEQDQRPDEIRLSARLYPLELAPPPLLWSQIAGTLDQPIPGSAQKTWIRLPAFRLAAAAVLAGLLLSSILLWLRQRPETPALAGTATGSSQAPASSPIPRSDTTPGEETVPREERAAVLRSSQAAAIMKPGKEIPEKSSFGEKDYAAEDDNNRVIAAASVTLLQPAENTLQSEVDAPPLRDSKGQIILDRKLLTTPDGNYLTVTSPNGQQTRVSSKFLPVIGYMNAEPKPEEYLDLVIRESAFWKMKFQEWRNQLVSRYRYAPDAGNFLDILELKSLLEKEMR